MVESIKHWLGLLVPGCPAVLSTHCFDLLLDLIDLGELILRKLGIDPALAGGVVLTTVTDTVGFASLLGLGTLFLT